MSGKPKNPIDKLKNSRKVKSKLDKRLNKILEDDEFVPLDEL